MRETAAKGRPTIFGGFVAQQGATIADVFKSFRRVFLRIPYIVIAIGVILTLLFLVVWLPNLHLLRLTLTSDLFEAADKARIIWSSFGAIQTNLTTLTMILTIVVSLLSGVNIAMLVFYLRRRIAREKAGGVGLLGTTLGLFGVGCASCGSVILSSVFGLGATAGFLGVFPLRGAEFGIIGVAALLTSIVLIAKKIENPALCNIHLKHYE